MSFKIIDIDQTIQRLAAKDAVIIDIRDEGSFDASHLPGAILINDTNLKDYIKSASKEDTHIIYCYHGNSSKAAANFFFENGFKDVYSMAGGFGDWNSRGEQIEK